MGRVLFVTGFKGGVGKTTVAANVASSLRALGSRVLLIDGDFGMRCLDMVLGLESETRGVPAGKLRGAYCGRARRFRLRYN